MPKLSRPFIVEKRKNCNYKLTLSLSSALPQRVCVEWYRKSFKNFPDALAIYRYPRSMAEAERGALALIQYLKHNPADTPIVTKDILVEAWLKKFITLDDNPRSARLIGEGYPYSPDTIDMYRRHFQTHIQGDPFLKLKMPTVEETDALGFIGRIGNRTNKHHKPLAGTRTYQIVVKFIRMAFREYGRTHKGWINPFSGIDAPKFKDTTPQGALEEHEIIKLFAGGVITDPLERAVCAAMFWAGLRRSEIWGLKPEDLDWRTPQLKIVHAWKRYNSTNKELGDPKWHKLREAPFPDILQAAIKNLWNINGKHEFVFCRKDGSQPSASYIRYHLPRWLQRAGISCDGRKIVPHSSRHSLASVLEAAGTPLRYIQDMLGHSDLKTTLGYLHSPQGTLNNIAKKIDTRLPDDQDRTHQAG